MSVCSSSSGTREQDESMSTKSVSNDGRFGDEYNPESADSESDLDDIWR